MFREVDGLNPFKLNCVEQEGIIHRPLDDVSTVDVRQNFLMCRKAGLQVYFIK